mgnify:CR=1 FL=1
MTLNNSPICLSSIKRLTLKNKSAFLENDIRRILAFSIINQGGFMVCAVGIGTPLAIAGGTAHAFCCVIYTALLWMSAGAVIHRTGKSKCTDLGGLYHSMPITFCLAIIGALAIAAAPFASGFTSKTIILKALSPIDPVDPRIEIDFFI